MGTLQTAVERCAGGLVEVEASIKQALREAEVAHFDESGCYLGGKRYWLHVASTPRLTHYGWHPKRGTEATDALGILPQFRGWAIHDGWSPYWRYEQCRHGLCNVHHQRELTYVFEQEQQPWAQAMIDLLLGIKARVAEVQAAGGTSLDTAAQQEFSARYQQILQDGLALHPPPVEPRPPGQRGRRKQSKAKNLLDRLRQRREAVLAFRYDFRVPFDNNLAERDIRMLKVQQKISGCFRSEEGATAFCRIRSYLSTLRKQGHPLLTAIASVFTSNPLLPAFTAE